MYMRIIRGQPKPGKLDELAQKWKEAVETHMRGIPGFRNAYLSGDRNANRSVSVILMDSKPDEATTAQLTQKMTASLADVTGGPPSFEEYEVLAQV